MGARARNAKNTSTMDKKKIIIIASVVVLLLCAGLGYMVYSYMQESAEKEEMLKLAEMDKREMEHMTEAVTGM